MIVSKSMTFDAAHFLPFYKGKCSNLHGHSWTIEFAVKGEVDKQTGMVIDFTDIKSFLDCVKEELDHTLLNDIIPNPTAENICYYIKDRLESDDWGLGPVKLAWIKVWETSDSMAELLYD